MRGAEARSPALASTELIPACFTKRRDFRIWEVVPTTDLPKVLTLPGLGAPDSPLTCVGLGGTSRRLYYLDADRQVHQAASKDEASFHDQVVGGTKAVPGSDLTCTTDARGRGMAR